MAFEKSPYHSINTPALLFVGPQDSTADAAVEYIQQHVCPQAGCGVCRTCISIRMHEHHALLWICPEKGYTLADIEPLLETMHLQRSAQEPFFFVLEKVHELTSACANTLLKSLEEPPLGYTFLLTTHTQAAVIATINSRCFVQYIQAPIQAKTHPLVQFFTTHTHAPLEFLELLEKETPSESETSLLIDSIISYWIKRHTDQATDIQYVRFFALQLQQLPMPGSSKIFWKNMYMQLFTLNNNQRL